MAKILVADNDPKFVNLMRSVLGARGHEVTVAFGGKQVLEVMRKEKPDLVLLEIMMSYVLEGLDVCREMAGDPQLKDVPVIVVTSLRGERKEVTAPVGEYVQVDEWIQKPVKAEELVAKVEEVLRKRE